MKNDIYGIVKDYVIKNPTLPGTEIADKILEDGTINKSHRTIRWYVGIVRDDIASGQADLPFEEDNADQIKDLTDQLEASNELINDLANDLANLVSDVIEANTPRKPKVLYLDIETSRMIVGVWGFGTKVHIGPEQMIKDYLIYGFAARWQGSSDTISCFVTPEEAIARDDFRVMSVLWDLLEEADAVITHNGNKFDIPKIKARMVQNGLAPLSSFRSIDTYQLVSKQFAFSSNALKFLAETLTEKQKKATTYSLWIECEKGIPEALKYMEEYCVGDIDALQAVYLALRPYIKGHANLAVLTDSEEASCPNCGSESLTVIDSLYTTQQNAFSEVRCNDCGAVNRTKDSLINSAKRKAMIVPSAH